ncbi:MAG: type II toxin-antitoxin system VapC family toxin [Okeania sp. SIO3B5]|uniref:type II toxin-antitoxin system VapC family toxin n=1 Tax=Okeania sp. SIO3B5 TaxID=2607811 RepID=UPI001401AB38|nr:PIN domain-containing protein [Okeania sp. SIO3B5]NEO53860.1 type II toxin-antitoxin system VapC family toxin [Okeania sp. SIO3B5]
MSNKTFVDTSFVIALINKRDQYHQQARELADRFDGYPLLSTDAILLEIGNALARNYKDEAIEIIEHFLSSQEIEIVRLTPQLFDKGFALYKSYQDQSWGLVDCISFVVMREANITQALTSDRHFRQAGFQTLMS